jgi:hypothetical protein
MTGGVPWTTVKFCPPIVIEPARPWSDAGIAEIEYVTVPFPLPEAPPVTVTNGEFETAVQPQPAADATLTVRPEAPVVGAVSVVADSVYVHL